MQRSRRLRPQLKHDRLARDLAVIEVARESQAAWGRVEAQVDTLVLTPESFDAVADMVANPRPATQALRDLMRPTGDVS